MDSLRVGWIQMDIQWEAPEENIWVVERLMGEGSADVWVLPEMWSTGFTMRVEAAEPPEGPAWQAMRRWAADLNALILGSVATRLGARGRNRLYAVFPDGQTLIYDKRHLFRMAGEHRVYEAGEDRLIVEWRGWRITPLICYDLRFPAWSRRTPAYDYDLMVYVANWPQRRHLHWEVLLRARAIENQAYILGVNRIGRDPNGHHYAGGSQLIDFRGEVLLHSGQAEGSWITEVSQSLLREYRESFPVWRDADAFELMRSMAWG